jgi:hypothetical protein
VSVRSAAKGRWKERGGEERGREGKMGTRVRVTRRGREEDVNGPRHTYLHTNQLYSL